MNALTCDSWQRTVSTVLRTDDWRWATGYRCRHLLEQALVEQYGAAQVQLTQAGMYIDGEAGPCFYGSAQVGGGSSPARTVYVMVCEEFGVYDVSDSPLRPGSYI